MDRRLPSQCRTGVDASSPRMAPTVTPARISPIVAVPMPRPALMAGSRGPHAETVIPPSPNAAVTVHRQRASAGRPSVTAVSVSASALNTFQPPLREQGDRAPPSPRHRRRRQRGGRYSSRRYQASL